MAIFGTTFRVRVRMGHLSKPPTKHATPKNENLDLGIWQHLKQLLGLELGLVISACPQPSMSHQKIEVGSRHFATFGTTFRVRVRVKHLGIGLGLSTFWVRVNCISENFGDVPRLPGNEKVGFQVKVTLWF